MSLGYNPTIKVYLTGLMAVTQEGNRAKIGIIKQPQHSLVLFIVETSSGRPVIVDILTDRDQTSEIRLEVNSPEIGFHCNGPFARTSRYDDEYDFRWAVNLDGKEFHNTPLTRRLRDGIPVIPIQYLYIDRGTFYCANKFKVRKGLLREPISRRVRQEFSFVMGANLTLGSGHRARLIYGNIERFCFVETEKYYVIIANLPTSSPPKASSHSHGEESHLKHSGRHRPNHFQFYYDVFDVNEHDRYDIGGISRRDTGSPNAEPPDEGPLDDFFKLPIIDFSKSQHEDALKITSKKVTYSRPCLPIFLSQTSIED